MESPTNAAEATSESKQKNQINAIKSPLIFDNFSKVPLSKTPGTKLTLCRNARKNSNFRKKRLSFDENSDKELGITHDFDLFDDNSSEIDLSQCSAGRKKTDHFGNKSLLHTEVLDKEQNSTEDSENIENIAKFLQHQLVDKPNEENIEKNKLNFSKTIENKRTSKITNLNSRKRVHSNCSESKVPKKTTTNDTISSVVSIGKTKNNKNKIPLVLMNKCDVSMKINFNEKKYSLRKKSENISKNSTTLISNCSKNSQNSISNENEKCVLDIKAKANLHFSTVSKVSNLPCTSDQFKDLSTKRDDIKLKSTDSTNFRLLTDSSFCHELKSKMEELKQLEKYYHKMEDLENAINIWKNGFNETINDLSKLMGISVDEICHSLKIPVKFLEEN